MGTALKICLVAVLFCAGAFGLQRPQKSFSSFLLSRTLNPKEAEDFNTWGAAQWYDAMRQKQQLLAEECPSCLSLREEDINAVFVTSPMDIAAAFPVSGQQTRHQAAWSTTPFNTYILYRNNVFTCGGLYLLAQVGPNGEPIETLVLDNDQTRLSPIRFKCENIEVHSDATDGLEDGLDLEFGGNIPKEDFVELIPGNLYLRIEPGNVLLQREQPQA